MMINRTRWPLREPRTTLDLSALAGKPLLVTQKTTAKLLLEQCSIVTEPYSVDAQFKAEKKIQELLTICPSAARIADKNGMLPLHHAAKCGATKTTVLRLFEAFPQGVQMQDDLGHLPIHYCVQSHANQFLYELTDRVAALLLKWYPEGAQHADQSGSLPLHYLCQSATTPVIPTVVKLLINVHPEGCSVEGPMTIMATDAVNALPDEDGDDTSPNDNDREALNKKLYYPLEMIGQQLLNIVTTEDFTGLPLNLDAAASMLLPHSPTRAQKAYHDAYKKLLRALIQQRRHGHCVEELLAKYPESFSEPNDTTGKLPLHEYLEAAAESTRLCCSNLYILEKIVRAHPDALKQKDGQGRLPLHWVIAHATRSKSAETAAVEYIFGQYPEASNQADVAGDYPLHLFLRGASRRPPWMLRLGLSLATKRALVQGCPPKALFRMYESSGTLQEASRLNDKGETLQLMLESFSAAELLQHGVYPLHDLVESGQSIPTDKLQTICTGLGHQLATFDPHGSLPLHVAARNHKTSQARLMAVALSYPPALGQATSDAAGFLPLHSALAVQALQKAEFLVGKYPQAARVPTGITGCHALHQICTFPERVRATQQSRRYTQTITVAERKELLRAILEQHPEAAQLKCQAHGRLPLHYACKSRMSLRGGLRVVLGAFRCGLEHQDNYGNYPLFYACEDPSVPLDKIVFLVRRCMGLFSGY